VSLRYAARNHNWVNFQILRLVDRDVPQIHFPVYRMQTNMQKWCLGENFWINKKAALKSRRDHIEAYGKEQAEIQAQEMADKLSLGLDPSQPKINKDDFRTSMDKKGMRGRRDSSMAGVLASDGGSDLASLISTFRTEGATAEAGGDKRRSRRTSSTRRSSSSGKTAEGDADQRRSSRSVKSNDSSIAGAILGAAGSGGDVQTRRSSSSKSGSSRRSSSGGGGKSRRSSTSTASSAPTGTGTGAAKVIPT
jgi:hypothetical protein